MLLYDKNIVGKLIIFQLQISMFWSKVIHFLKEEHVYSFPIKKENVVAILFQKYGMENQVWNVIFSGSVYIFM